MNIALKMLGQEQYITNRQGEPEFIVLPVEAYRQLIKPKTSVFVIGDEFSNAYSSNTYQNKFWLKN
jgi:hypothetical protein